MDYQVSFLAQQTRCHDEIHVNIAVLKTRYPRLAQDQIQNRVTELQKIQSYIVTKPESEMKQHECPKRWDFEDGTGITVLISLPKTRPVTGTG